MKNKCERTVNKYMKKMLKNCFAAFSMGYSDGEQGKPQTVPDIPESASGTLYAALLFASELYMDGYEAGKKSLNT